MDLAEEPRKIKIDGTEHEWIENSECDYNHCRRKKEDITWCDDCDKAFCKNHEDYHNNYETTETYCKGCWEIRKHEKAPDCVEKK